MSTVEFTSASGEQHYAELVRAAAETVVGLDFDGTLAPIVDDPTRAHIHPGARDVLVELATQVHAVAVVTGRPARQALDLGGLEDVGTAIAEVGKELYLFGQYGDERWSTVDRRVRSPRPPPGLATFERDLPRALRRSGAEAAYVEDKGLAVAVHTRRLEDPDETFARLLPALEELASHHDLVVEPGKNVIEVRASGTHKGVAVRTLVDELGAGGFLFAGDDLGDVEAFDAVRELRRGGMPGLLVCSATESDAEHPLARQADVVVDGPDGVLELLRQLTADAAALRA